jgi:hypothetical protein
MEEVGRVRGKGGGGEEGKEKKGREKRRKERKIGIEKESGTREGWWGCSFMQ